ncbi:MAG: YraN family protein [Pseudomonadales bacterium]
MYYPHQRGTQTERSACEFLQAEGLQLIERNFSCKAGEIDLIMQHRSVIAPQILVLVEVRYRRSQRYGGAAASVSPAKQQRLRRAAQYFCQTHKRYATWPMRFDVIAIRGGTDNLQITWLKSAFEC